jgi:hypothetical protein
MKRMPAASLRVIGLLAAVSVAGCTGKKADEVARRPPRRDQPAIDAARRDLQRE